MKFRTDMGAGTVDVEDHGQRAYLKLQLPSAIGLLTYWIDENELTGLVKVLDGAVCLIQARAVSR